MRRGLLLLSFGMALSQVAYAHGGVDRTVEVDAQLQSLDVRAPTDSVLAALGVAPEEAERHASALTMWMMEGLSATTPHGPCTLSSPVLSWSDDLVVRSDLSCGTGPVTLRDDTLVDAPLGEQTLVRIASDDAASVALLDATRPQTVLDASPSVVHTAAVFLWQGALHLITGYDHVLFLLCLLFVAGPTAQRRGRLHAARQLGWIVSAFTLGHSLTLVAAAMQWVTLPGRWVEAAIAGSIGVAAALNIARPDATSTHRPALAGAFGLIHGFGFSSVLAEVGLPVGERVVALLSFNVGIELAQLCVVALTIVPLAWLARRRATYRLFVMQGGSAAIAAVSVFWLTERVLGLGG